jgi:hypothetical protein
MSMWHSELEGDNRDENNEAIANVTTFYFDRTTDVNGEFNIDLTLLDVDIEQVLEVQSFVLNQTLSPVDNIVDKLFSSVVEISTTTIKGVVGLGNSATITLGLLFDSLLRAGSGIDVKVIVKVVRSV